MSDEWTFERIKEHINENVDEFQRLDYKAAEALARSPGKKKEVGKDVSAMANAAGGDIIYGVKEIKDDDGNVVDHELDPVDKTEFNKEWLNQVINGQIEPGLPGVETHEVTVPDQENLVLYVVEVPQGETAHQASDGRYYRRYGDEVLRMKHHEIVDVMSRQKHPKLSLEVWAVQIGVAQGRRVLLKVCARNRGVVMASNFKITGTFPRGVVHPTPNHRYSVEPVEKTWSSAGPPLNVPLFPEDRLTLGDPEMRLIDDFANVTDFSDPGMKALAAANVSFLVFADSARSRRLKTAVADIPLGVYNDSMGKVTWLRGDGPKELT